MVYTKSVERFSRISGAIIGMVRAESQQLYNRYINSHFEEFPGDAREICKQIVDRLWAGNFHRTSLGHYDFFWIRDFGTVAESLVKLGYGDEVRRTLNWALLQYREAGHVTLCIDRFGNTFNAPARQAIDALPWLLHALVVSDYKLRPIETELLRKSVNRYSKRFLDPVTGDIRSGVRFAEMRDAVRYDRSAYAISLVGRLSVCAKQLGLTFPFDVTVYQKLLDEKYWNGKYYQADRSTNVWSSESGLMPFFLKIITDKDKVANTCEYIRENEYSIRYPLTYCRSGREFRYRFGMGHWLMPEYQGTTVWTWLGAFYLHILHEYDRPEYDEEYRKLEALIMRHRTFPELVNEDGTWYKVPIYSGDPGMIWAALFLDLPKAS